MCIPSDLSTIQGLVNKYKLNEQHPLGRYENLLIQLYISKPEMTDDYAAQGNEHAIWRKMEGLVMGKYGYEHSHQAAAYLNRFFD